MIIICRRVLGWRSTAKDEEIALACGYGPIELCWMTWLIQPEGKLVRIEKYRSLLSKI